MFLWTCISCCDRSARLFIHSFTIYHLPGAYFAATLAHCWVSFVATSTDRPPAVDHPYAYAYAPDAIARNTVLLRRMSSLSLLRVSSFSVPSSAWQHLLNSHGLITKRYRGIAISRRSPVSPLTSDMDQQNYLLAEIIKAANPPPQLLFNVLRDRSIQPRWEDIPLPPGECQMGSRKAFFAPYTHAKFRKCVATS